MSSATATARAFRSMYPQPQGRFQSLVEEATRPCTTTGDYPRCRSRRSNSRATCSPSASRRLWRRACPKTPPGGALCGIRSRERGARSPRQGECATGDRGCLGPILVVKLLLGLVPDARGHRCLISGGCRSGRQGSRLGNPTRRRLARPRRRQIRRRHRPGQRAGGKPRSGGGHANGCPIGTSAVTLGRH